MFDESCRATPISLGDMSSGGDDIDGFGVTRGLSPDVMVIVEYGSEPRPARLNCL